MSDKTEETGVRMVALRTHKRGPDIVRKGQEFTATEQEAKVYATRDEPLAGPLEEGESDAPRRTSTRKSKTRKAATRRKGR